MERLSLHIDDYDGRDDVNNDGADDDDDGGRYCSPKQCMEERSHSIQDWFELFMGVSSFQHRLERDRERLIDFLVFYYEKHVNRSAP